MKSGDLLQKEIINSTGTSFWWLGQLGYAVTLCGKKLFLDAYLSENSLRQHNPIIDPKSLTCADYIFGTHDHIDHIDREAWKFLKDASPKAKFIVPAYVADDVSKSLNIERERIIGIDEGETVVLDGDITVRAVGAAHELPEKDKDGHFLHLSYFISGDGKNILHTGDTCIYDGYTSKLKALGEIDVLFLPINGRDAKRLRTNCIGNMTYQEAVDLCGALKPKLSVPGHYDMFRHNSEDPLMFADYIDAKYPSLKFWIGAYGTKIDF